MSITKNYQTAKGICKVTFSHPSTDGIKTIQVLGDFNNWDSKTAPKMKKGKSEFSTIIELAAGQAYQFKYLINGSNWENDTNADNYVQSPFGGQHNGVVVIDKVVKPATKATAKPVSVKTPPVKAVVAKPIDKKTTTTKVARVKKVVTPKAAASADTKAIAPKAEKKVAVKAEKKVAAKAVSAKAPTPKAEKPAVAKAKTVKPAVAKVKTVKPVVKK
jgi:hypothetical protein